MGVAMRLAFAAHRMHRSLFVHPRCVIGVIAALSSEHTLKSRNDSNSRFAYYTEAAAHRLPSEPHTANLMLVIDPQSTRCYERKF